MRKKLIITGLFLFLGASLLATPLSTQAQTANVVSSSQRALLLAQLDRLLEQIAYLQAQISLLQTTQTTASEVKIITQTAKDNDFEIYETHYFGNDFEAIYEVGSRLKLIRRDITTGNRISDLRLWDLFIDTVGRKEATYYIDEFRVFDKSSSDIGAFVELRRSSVKGDYWILGVNEDDFDPSSDVSRRRYQLLFVHEFAHLFMADMDSWVEDFTDEFWTARDFRHSRGLETLSGQDLEDALEEYYDDHTDEFVTDYATFNPEEDIAETFMYFVTQNKPTSRREKQNAKVLFMYDNDYLVELRDNIRDNLDLN